jgi:hypothetical protein
MWVINIRHWLDDTNSGPALPQLRFKVKKLSEIIMFATSLSNSVSAEAALKCWRRPKRKPCNGSMELDLDESIGQIHWCCSKCGDEGVITGWQGLIWDMTDADGLMQ